MNESIIGFIFSVSVGVVAFIIFTEVASSIRDWVIGRHEEPIKMSDFPPEPYVRSDDNRSSRGSGTSLLRQRHYRQVKHRPHSRWG